MGITNANKLPEIDQRLVNLVVKLGEIMDICVVCGHRGKVAQDAAFAAGASKVRFPRSRHNSTPAEAVDLAPIVNKKIPWSDIKAFQRMAAEFKRLATEAGIAIEWGGDWKMRDYPHFELKRKT
jgi:peptidoglycan L-alanyl-D-glutamate endopeptidase CwlK